MAAADGEAIVEMTSFSYDNPHCDWSDNDDVTQRKTITTTPKYTCVPF